MRKSLLVMVVSLCCFVASANEDWRQKTERAEYMHRAIKQVTDVMVYDIYSPPVSSRTYAYICIAGYETVAAGNASYQSFAGQLHGLTALPKPGSSKEYSFTIAATHAILTVGRSLVISEARVNQFYDSLMGQLKSSGIPEMVFTNSIAYGQQVAQHIIAWAALDNYKQTRTFSKYAVNSNPAVWKPTPPAYMRAVEPHWNKIRTFIMDSAQQFKPLPALPFSADTTSDFYKEAIAVRNAGANLTPEQKHIASFWDCNPFKMNVNGHVMYASKKISPGGHWINIAAHACKVKEADVMQTMEVYACLAITIADAFISCWDEKYRSNVIRPETYINKYIDGSWMPFLQTPPFPEYTSGHSVVSTASAIMLEKLLGENFTFTDETELEFGIPARSFTSFKQAAEEAAMSRFYGGIHYMSAIVNGSEEGKKIGLFMCNMLKTRNKK